MSAATLVWATLCLLVTVCVAPSSNPTFTVGRGLGTAYASDGTTMVWAGGEQATVCQASLEVYSPQLGVAVPIPSLPQATCYLAAASPSPGKFIIAGGENTGYTVFYDTVCIYMPSQGTFDCNTLAPLQVPRSRLGAASANGWTVFAGGFNGPGLAELDAYAPDGSHVTGMLTEQRKYPAVAGAGTLIYIAGGYNFTHYFNTIDVFDTVTQTVQALSATLSAARIQMTPVVSVNLRYVAFTGGLDVAGNISPSLDLYDTELGTMSYLQMADAVVYHAGAAVSNGTNELFIFAGGYEATSGVSVNVYFFDLATKSFTPSNTVLATARQYSFGGQVGQSAVIGGGEDPVGGYVLPIAIITPPTAPTTVPPTTPPPVTTPPPTTPPPTTPPPTTPAATTPPPGTTPPPATTDPPTTAPLPTTPDPGTTPPPTTPPPTTVGCVGQAPAGSVCTNGVWVINGSATLPELVIDGSPVTVTGNLTVINSTVTITLTPGSTTPITVSGCADFTGSTATVTSTDSSTSDFSVQLVDASCVKAPFTAVTLTKPVECKKQRWRAQQVTDGGVAALFSLEGKCNSAKLTKIIAAAVVGGLALVVIAVILLVVFLKPELPKSLFRRARAPRAMYVINA